MDPPESNFGAGTIHPVGISDLSIATFLFWRVKIWELHLEFSGSKTYEGDCTDPPPPPGGTARHWIYTGTASGSLTETLDLTADTSWGDGHVSSGGGGEARINDPVALVGLEDRVPYHEFKKTVTAGTVDYDWVAGPFSCFADLPASADIVNKISVALFSGDYSGSSQDRIVKSGGAFYPQMFVQFPAISPFNINQAFYGSGVLTISAGSIELQDIGGTALGTIPFNHGDTGATWSVTGYLKVHTLW